LKAVEKWDVGGEGVEQTKVKYTHSGDTLRNPFEYWLKTLIMKDITKIRTVCVKGHLWEGECE
jgi:hypothetical protein